MSPADPDYVANAKRQIDDFERRASTITGRKPKNTLFQTRNRNGAATMHNLATDTADIPRPPQMGRAARVPDEITINGRVAPTSLLDIILVAGSDPNFDVEKFRSLVAIQREEQDRQDARTERDAALAAEAAFDAALSEVQGKISVIGVNQYNSQTKSSYADYAALDRVIKPIYSPAGFSLSFDEEDSPKPEHIRIVCWVTHVAPGAKRSHKRKYHADMPSDGKGARGGDVMSKTHAAGAAFTYGKRYVAGNVFNIAIGRDNDGNAPPVAKAADARPQPGTISADQAEQIRSLLQQKGVAPRAFLQFIRLPRIEDIGVEHFDRAINKIKTFGGKS